MVRKHFFVKIFLALSLFLFSQISFAELKATVDRTTVYLGDSVQLNIHTGDSDTAITPDFNVLQKDFDILSAGQSSQILVTNGKSYTDAIWVLVLAPKNPGQITIPAITVGNQTTKPIHLDVKPANTNSSIHADNRHVFMTANLTPQSPYVQSQAMYSLKIYYDKQIENPKLTEPASVNATFVHLGNDHSYNETVNGKTYQVLEVHFAMFPQQSGDIQIDGSVFSGSLLNKQSPGQYFSDMWRPFRVAANNLKIQVKPIPANANTQWWLPAKSINITDNWSSSADAIQAGTPITRTITISGIDVLANQLPEVFPKSIDNFQIYPDQPESKTTTNGKHLYATRVEKAAFIANKPGNYTLPAVKVHWWNTDTNKSEVATLPAKTIKVLPGAAATTTTMLPPVVPPANNNNKPALTTSPQHSFWQDKWFWIAGGCLFVWLITVSVILFRKSNTKKTLIKKTQHDKDNHIDSIRAARSAVKAAMQDNNYAAFQKALIFLAQATWIDKKFLSLGDVLDVIDNDDAKAVLNELNEYLYHGSIGVIDCKQIWRKVEKCFILDKKSKNGKDPLPSLY